VTLPVPVVPVVTIAGDDVMSSEPAPSGDSVTVAAAIDTTVSANKPQAAEARDLVIVIQDDQESVTARVKASATDRTIETPIIIDSEPESITANTSIPVVRYYDKAPPHRHFLSATPQGNKKQAYQTVVFESKKHGTQKIFAGMRREKSDYVFICAMKAPIDQDPSSTLATRNKEPGDQSDSNCEEGHCQGFIWQYIYVNYEDMDPFVSLSDEGKQL
jgi:hypothetical protein